MILLKKTAWNPSMETQGVPTNTWASFFSLYPHPRPQVPPSALQKGTGELGAQDLLRVGDLLVPSLQQGRGRTPYCLQISFFLSHQPPPTPTVWACRLLARPRR